SSPSLDKIQLAKTCAALGWGALLPNDNNQGDPLIVPGTPDSSKISRILKPSFANGRTSSSRQFRQIGWVPRANQSDICRRSRVGVGFWSRYSALTNSSPI